MNLGRPLLALLALLGVLPPPYLHADTAQAGSPAVDATTGLPGKVMCGYQGWFNCEGDGAGRDWVHWTRRRGPLGPGNAKVDLWPDVSELGPDERFATGFTNAAGRTAEVFSSFKQATVLRHFEWMRQSGIDGVFLQRFVVDLRDPRGLRHNNTVLAHCREGARRSGRAFVVMYDLSGLGSNRMDEVIGDWRRLRTEQQVTGDAAYLRHRGKPLVAVWGVGFSDDRRYTLAECRRLVEHLRQDGCAVMLGVPTHWRELKNDALKDPALHEILRRADIISPWMVGRLRTPEDVARHATRVLPADLAWCRTAGVDYLPVVYPGFSWHNMHGGALDAIPRRQGRFLWSQFTALQRSGIRSAYVAMFDEVDEGTAIFKCTNDVPVDERSKFVTCEGLPSDFYLRLTGAGGKLLRGEIPFREELPDLR